MRDLREHEDLVRALEDVLRGFEVGGPPPSRARELLTELAVRLAESSPAETGLSPHRLRAAREAASRGVEGLEAELPAVQGREAETALRALSQLFRDQAEIRGSRGRDGHVRTVGREWSRRMPRWLVAVITVVVCLGIVAYGLRPRPLAAATPRAGTFSGTGSRSAVGFGITFSVSGGAAPGFIANRDSWRASCRSGKTWVDQSGGGYDSAAVWHSRDVNYVTANPFGTYVSEPVKGNIDEHVHIIQDTAQFTSSTRATGVFNLSVVLYENGQPIDTCHTGTVRWTAHWVSPNVPSG